MFYARNTKTENDKKTYLLPDTIYIKKLNFK